jgi:O-antigen/teichoic acid export membrane protein
MSNINKQISLKKNIFWAFFGNALYALTQWLLLVVMAKFGNIEMVGQYSYGLALTAPIILFLSFNLSNVYITTKDPKFYHFLTTRIISMILGLIVVLIIIGIRQYETQLSIFIIIIAINKMIEAVSDIYYASLQKNERMDLISISKTIKGVAVIVFFTVALYLTKSLAVSVGIITIVWFITLVGFDMSYVKKIAGSYKDQFSFPRVKEIVLVSYPLGIVATIDALNTNIPRYFIQHYNGEAELGYFSAIVYLMVAGGTVVIAVGQALIPRLSKYFHESFKEFKSFSNKVIGIGVIFCIIFLPTSIIFGKPVLAIIYSKDFIQYYDVYIWTMVTSVVWYISSLLTYVITAAKYYKVQVPLFLFMTVSTLILCAFLVPKLGVVGATYAFCIGNTVRLIGSIFVVGHIYKKQSNSINDKVVS